MLIRPIAAGDDEGGFTCGVPTLDRYLAKHARGNHDAGIARCYVLVDETAVPARVSSYYTLTTRTVAPTMVASLLPGRLPTYPLSVIYIGMFAVTNTEKRRGLGTTMMRDALERSLMAADQVGATGVFLDSLSDDSTTFYARLGFVPVGEPMSPQPMFLPMATLRQVGP
ncbi:MAG: GNAT family N-acetyltransferase [Gemmatimonadota bacterium]|nr:GNAT family N-acetyltransferase [Gemmatimonadota bacterium]